MKRLLLGLVCIVPACVSMEVDVPEICVRHQDVQMHGLGPAEDGTTEESTIGDSFTFAGIDLLTDLIEGEIESEAIAELRGIRIIAPESVGQMGFVTEAHARISTDGDRLPPIELGCGDGTCRSIGRELELAPTTVTSVLDYLHAGNLLIDVGLTGRLPAPDLTIEVDLCLIAAVSLERSL